MRWMIGGYLRGTMLPIVLGTDKDECLLKFPAALKATPHGAEDLAPLCFFQWVPVQEDIGNWIYRDEVKDGYVRRVIRLQKLGGFDDEFCDSDVHGGGAIDP